MAVLVRERDEFHAAFASFQSILQDPRLGRPDRGIALLLPHLEEGSEARTAIGERGRLEALVRRL